MNGVMDEIASALSDSVNPCDRVAYWSLRWSLARGQLTCSRCQASQTTRQGAEPFLHRGACPGNDEHRYPFQELAALLLQLGTTGSAGISPGDWRTARQR
ncbi:hypothetical protein [Pseudomonas sp. dw_358]|uniref:hypothetical protein n=1 Tax=Pseudomonas sp. dw_358 TaxID=2720083 RepID=UPI001BD289AB|nr:hypothetical protein [Pseudomonas sp. dw_358]